MSLSPFLSLFAVACQGTGDRCIAGLTLPVAPEGPEAPEYSSAYPWALKSDNDLSSSVALRGQI